jgi:hypothetical protein
MRIAVAKILLGMEEKYKGTTSTHPKQTHAQRKKIKRPSTLTNAQKVAAAGCKDMTSLMR